MAKIQYAYELANRFVEAKKAGKPIPFFYKVLNSWPEHKRQETIEMIRNQGFDLEPPNKSGKPKAKRQYRSSGERIFWTDSEREFIANEVWKMRKKDPVSSLTTLVGNAQEQLPKDRRRPVNTALAKQFAEEIKQRFSEVENKALLFDQVRTKEEKKEDTAKAPSREEVLASVTDSEAFDLYAERILNHLEADDLIQYVDEYELLRNLPYSLILGYVADHYLGKMFTAKLPQEIKVNVPAPQGQTYGNGTTQQPSKRADKRKKTVAVFGLKPVLNNRIAEELGDRCKLRFIDNKRIADVPQSCDLYIVSRWCSHATDEQIARSGLKDKLINVRKGGVTEIIDVIKENL